MTSLLNTALDNILAGQFAVGPLSADDMVQICNAAADVLEEGPDGFVVDESIGNLSLWLGGINKDIQVYAWQLIRRVKGLAIGADDKTAVRLSPLEDKIFLNPPYQVSEFKAIDHYAWPKEYLNGTFEDRLANLPEALTFEEDLDNLPTGDQIISGTAEPLAEALDINVQYVVMKDLIYALDTSWIKYNEKANILMDSQLTRASDWVDENLDDEMKIVFWQMVMNVHGISFKNPPTETK